MGTSSTVYLGIKGSVVALDRATGNEIWNVALKGGDFVNVLACESEIFAATKGEIFCLDSTTGHIRWHNPLKGLGYGLVTIAVEGAQTRPGPIAKRKQQEAQAAAAAAVVAAG